MSENLEIEFKTMLSEEEYLHVLHYFNGNETNSFTQENHYFDTENFELKNRKIGLRVRTLPTSAELTIKIPQTIGKLEINAPLSVAQAKKILSENKLPKNNVVAKKLEELSLEVDTFKHFGTLTTKRVEVEVPEGLIALDESWYGDGHDYELELEVSDAEEGKKAWLQLLETLSIQNKPAKNKVARMFEQLGRV
ncbi:Uncharacterized protein YjbK [Pilibacter termitis]|uniref:Uncharacterized protein YjbK n=1 Tax=Pilibacter termitis TaxID=263852 RepID=A0A1T4LFW8_9ENTE|nr:CYTH domain-containing protein [Pilibacter termitis]SJZ53521.1 Uncharacterized protein YjbK [Pilibacter termitis]